MEKWKIIMRPWLNAPWVFISFGIIMITTHSSIYRQKMNILTFKSRYQHYYKCKNHQSIRIYLTSGWTTCYVFNSKHLSQSYISSWMRCVLTVYFMHCFFCNSLLTKISIQNNRASSVWDKKFLPEKEKEIYQFICNLGSPYIFVKQGMLQLKSRQYTKLQHS